MCTTVVMNFESTCPLNVEFKAEVDRRPRCELTRLIKVRLDYLTKRKSFNKLNFIFWNIVYYRLYIRLFFDYHIFISI